MRRLCAFLIAGLLVALLIGLLPAWVSGRWNWLTPAGPAAAVNLFTFLIFGSGVRWVAGRYGALPAVQLATTGGLIPILLAAGLTMLVLGLTDMDRIALCLWVAGQFIVLALALALWTWQGLKSSLNADGNKPSGLAGDGSDAPAGGAA